MIKKLLSTLILCVAVSGVNAQAIKTMIIADGAVLTRLPGQYGFTEGPATDAQGNVYFTDQPNDKIYKWSTDGSTNLYMEKTGRSNGLYFDRQGNLIACADLNNQLVRIDRDKKMTVLASGFDGKKFNGPNDLWIDAKGGIYFTDPYYQRPYWTRTKPAMEEQRVYYLSPDQKRVSIAASGFVRPNGLIGSADGRTLYIADIGGDKTYAYHVNDDATLGERRLFVNMGSDGMTIDNEDNIYLVGKPGVTVFNQAGIKIEQIPVPEAKTANITFGGVDRKTLFITASTSVYTLAMRVSGVLPGPVVTAEEQSRKMGRGVNIIGYDSAFWRDRNNGRFKERYFTMLKQAGFSSVRLNLNPFSHMDARDQLNPAWLETLDWLVAKSLDAKLMPVLDMHEYNAMADDPLTKKEKFLAVWRQLAPRYKDQSSDVIFELLNEPNGKLTDELWNEFSAEALAIVRQTNPTRTVIIGPGHWNGIGNLSTLVLPSHDRNLIVTTHFYDPMQFTHQGAPWSEKNKDQSGISWLGTAEEKSAIDLRLQQAADWAKANGRPMYLGEFGAYDKGDMASRARYTAYVARTAERLGFSWAYWQFDSDFIVYDVNKEAWIVPIRDALMQ